MADKPIVCVGDGTSHGGKVLQGSASSSVRGKPIARLGDEVSCPKCHPGKFVISAASGNHKVDGKPVARHGDAVSCGATLVASRDASTT